jgi:uncharacterized glyoxalase superfamily protein PhnB
MHTVTTHLWFAGNCGEAMDFYARAFGTEEKARVPGPEGKGVMHGLIALGDSNIMMADAWPGAWEQGPAGSASAGLFLYVPDVDAAYARAMEAGCESLGEPEDMFWGDRMAKVKDPYGHCWGIATHKWVMSPEQMQAAGEQWKAGQ